MKLDLYSLKGLAEELGTSHGYLKLLMLKVRRGEIDSWRGFRFLSVGTGNRSVWLAYPEKDKISFHDVVEDSIE